MRRLAVLGLALGGCATCPDGLTDGDERLPAPCLHAPPAGLPQPSNPPIGSFVVRSGNRLLADGQPFRIAGPNIYWLGLDEWYGVHPPSRFRPDDVLLTA